MKIVRAAGWESHNEAHRPRRIGLRPSEARDGRERTRARCQMQKIYDGEVSSSPLRLAKVHSITSLARQVMAFRYVRRPAGAL